MNIQSLKDEFNLSSLIVLIHQVVTLFEVIINIICWKCSFKPVATVILRLQLVLLLVHSTVVLLDAHPNFFDSL